MMDRFINNWKLVILGAIMVLGLALRCYNLNFPSIGYHNMRENELLSLAQGMQDSGDLASRKIYFYNAFGDDLSHKVFSGLPLVSYQILVAWKLLGHNLWGPRLFNVIFGVSGIPVIYLMAFLLFGNAAVALFCAFLLAIMPIGVFFSRNLQPDIPAFFFMLLGNLFYLRFVHSSRKYQLFCGGLALFLAWLYEPKYLIGAMPFVLCLPFGPMFRQKGGVLKFIFALVAPYLLIPFSIFWLKGAGQWAFNYKFTPAAALLPAYWRDYGSVISWYVGENYTAVYALLAACGMCLACFKNKGLLDRYIIGWGLSAAAYFILFPQEVYQNSYLEMPYLLPVCIAGAYAVYFISGEIKRFFRPEPLVYLMMIILAISAPFVSASIYRLYGTVFLGLDVAGESLKALTAPEERIFLLTHPQGYGIARYASRYVGTPSTVEDFKEKERIYHVRFVCVYPGEYLALIEKDNLPLFNYIQDNYHVKEAGLIENPNKIGYLIMEKGSSQGKKLKDFLQSISGRLQTRAIYNVWGRYIFFYTIRPDITQSTQDHPNEPQILNQNPALPQMQGRDN